MDYLEYFKRNWLYGTCILLTVYFTSMVTSSENIFISDSLQTWFQADSNCSLYNFNLSNNTLRDLLNENESLWIGAYVTHSTWFRLESCKRRVPNEKIELNVSDSDDPIETCFQHCNKERFSLNRQICVCGGVDGSPGYGMRCSEKYNGVCGDNASVLCTYAPLKFDQTFTNGDCIAFGDTYMAEKCDQHFPTFCQNISEALEWHDAFVRCPVNKQFSFKNTRYSTKYWLPIFRNSKWTWGSPTNSSRSQHSCVAVTDTGNGTLMMQYRNCQDLLPALCNSVAISTMMEMTSSSSPNPETNTILSIMSTKPMVSAVTNTEATIVLPSTGSFEAQAWYVRIGIRTLIIISSVVGGVVVLVTTICVVFCCRHFLRKRKSNCSVVSHSVLEPITVLNPQHQQLNNFNFYQNNTLARVQAGTVPSFVNHSFSPGASPFYGEELEINTLENKPPDSQDYNSKGAYEKLGERNSNDGYDKLNATTQVTKQDDFTKLSFKSLANRLQGSFHGARNALKVPNIRFSKKSKGEIAGEFHEYDEPYEVDSCHKNSIPRRQKVKRLSEW